MDNNETGEAPDIDDLDPDHRVAFYLQVARESMIANKPNDRTPIDRHWAIALTELEKVMAYFDYWVCRNDE